MLRKNRDKRVNRRVEEAIIRNESYGKLSTKDKIGKLDSRLGKGKGAVKQRAKLIKGR